MCACFYLYTCYQGSFLHRYSTLVGIISKKFTTKRKRRELQTGGDDDENGHGSDDNDGLIMTTSERRKGKRTFIKAADI